MTDKINVIVVDDEPLGRDGLVLRLESIENIKVLATCENTQQAEAAITEHQPDAVFLDIEMPEENGVAFTERLKKQGVVPFVVFVTAYKQHALEAFDLDAVDYLVKPVNLDRLRRSISRIEARMASVEAEAEAKDNQSIAKLRIKEGDTSYFVECKDILWIEAAGDYMCVNTAEQTHILRKTMKELTQILDPKTFKRVHRSTILNITKIVSASTHTNGELFVSIGNEKTFKVSRSYAADLKSAL